MFYQIQRNWYYAYLKGLYLDLLCTVCTPNQFLSLLVASICYIIYMLTTLNFMLQSQDRERDWKETWRSVLLKLKFAWPIRMSFFICLTASSWCFQRIKYKYCQYIISGEFKNSELMRDSGSNYVNVASWSHVNSSSSSCYYQLRSIACIRKHIDIEGCK